MATKNLGRVVGKSAYEVWLEAGNTGSAEDFFASLAGKAKVNVEAYDERYILGYTGTDGILRTTVTNCIVSSNFIFARKGSTITVDDENYTFAVCEYSEPLESKFSKYSGKLQSTSTYTTTADGYIRVNIRKVDESNFADTSDSKHLILNIIQNEIDAIVTAYNYATKNSIYIKNPYIEWIQGYNNSTNEKILYNRTHICNKDLLLAKVGSTINVDDGDIYSYKISYYNLDGTYRMTTVTKTGLTTITTDSLIRISLTTKAGDIITDTRMSDHLILNLIGEEISVSEQIKNNDDTVKDLEKRIERLELRIKNPSKLFRRIDFPKEDCIGWYKCLQEDVSLFNHQSVVSEVLAKFDELVTQYPQYMTRTELGLGSGNPDSDNVLEQPAQIVEYDFTPLRFDFKNVKVNNVFNNVLPNPKFLIFAAEQGSEKSNVYGIYYFLKDLLENWDKNPVLEYIHRNITLKIIPIMCPYGFNNTQYTNYNGVNLNRNWACDAYTPGGTGTENSGTAAFSEPECQIVRDFMLRNKDALMVIDSHTNSAGAVSSYPNVNWHSYCVKENDDYLAKALYASNSHIVKITDYFIKEFNLNTNGELCGKIANDNSNARSSSEKYAYDQGMLAMVFEGFYGFPNTTPDTEVDKKANAELIGNWIATVTNTYKNY